MASDDHRSAAEIEREIEAERNALTRTLDEIQERLSFESLSGDLYERVRDSGGDVGRAVIRSVRDNPVPLALTAIGLTWLMISQRNSGHEDPYGYDPYDGYIGRRPASDWDDEYAGVGGRTTPVGGTGAYRRPIYDASGRPISGDVHEDHESRWDSARHAVSGAAQSARDRARSGAHAASSGVGSARDSAASGYGSARDRAAGGLHSAGDKASAGLHAGQEATSSRYRAGRDAIASGAKRVRSSFSRGYESGRSRARGAYASAAELRERITHGTQDLSAQARARIIAARTRAYEAQLRAEQYASRGRDKAVDLFEDQPLVIGALALAFGAALGGLLPRTSREDDAFGAYRDDLFEEAERVYREERSKLEAVARETAEEARRVARSTAEDIRGDLNEAASEIGATARSKLSDAEAKAKEAAEQVGEKAKSEAENKNLGQR
ncbi:DUF3618 domain-containing protein [Roseitranquillus sediminis]|uniref:DUF3618 domain-containing protein n=1 Tax=Roseitranquillus sediminis TaxID=2809051 RepID=UPI001D0C44B2|nr:DUF3618 domain-containing protein [Roseitranquillus sediminis]MBM9593148.1 DUF3618 domain-containing protein [Roseitranquillus sediminis]